MPPPNVPKPEPGNSDLKISLPLDAIKKQETRDMVGAYFEHHLSKEQAAAFVRAGTKLDLAYLRSKIEIIDKDANPQEFINKIIEGLQEDSKQQDTDVGWKTPEGDHPGYMEQLFALTGANEHCPSTFIAKYDKVADKIDWDSPLAVRAAVNRLKLAIDSIPVDVKSEHQRNYIAAFLKIFVVALKKAKKTGLSLKEEDVLQAVAKMENDSELKNFSAWAKQNVKPDNLKYHFTPLDTQAIVGLNNRIKTVEQTLTSAPKEAQDYYTAQIAKISPLVFGNREEAEKLLLETEKEVTGLKAFLDFGNTITEAEAKYAELLKKHKDTDPKLSTRISAEKQKFDVQQKQQATLSKEPDHQKRLALMDFAALETPIKSVTADMTAFETKKTNEEAETAAQRKAEEEKEKAAATDPANQPGPLDELFLKGVENDKGFQAKVKELTTKTPILGFIIGMFFAPSTVKTLEKMGIIKEGLSVDGFLGKLLGDKKPEEVSELKKKTKGILKDQFHMDSVKELDVVGKTTVQSFMKTMPDEFKDSSSAVSSAGSGAQTGEQKYGTLREALKKNGAEDEKDEKKTVFEFVMEHSGTWKK